MSLTVCTGWSLQGWESYGRNFLESFNAYWPAGVKLHICGERDAMQATSARATGLHHQGEMRHEVTFHTLEAIGGLPEFLARHDNPIAHGRARAEGQNWKERAIVAGYNWRYDACKFSRQGFIPHHVSRHVEAGGFLLWLDGDVVTHAPIADERQVTGLLPPDKSIAYLGREPKHPDIAFQLYRMDLRTVEFLREFRVLYETDAVFKLKEWHSAFVWHHILRRPRFLEVAHNLTPGGSGHVWHQSPLRAWGDHLKGERKRNGRSPEARR